MLNYCVAVAGGAFDCSALPPDVPPAPDRNAFELNEFAANGAAPDPLHPMAAYAADITYIMLESGHINCGAKNEYGTRSFAFSPPVRLTSGRCI